jgi:hypothetical protein
MEVNFFLTYVAYVLVAEDGRVGRIYGRETESDESKLHQTVCF